MRNPATGRRVCSVPQFHPTHKGRLCGFEMDAMEPAGRYDFCSEKQRDKLGVRRTLDGLQDHRPARKLPWSANPQNATDFVKTSKQGGETLVEDKLQEKLEKKKIV